MNRDLIDRLWACNEVDALFGTALRTPTPWPRGGKDRGGPTYDRIAAEELCTLPVDLVDIDPRSLLCTQPWLVREHVAYYLTGRWELSGRTSADQHSEANRFPIIMQDRKGRQLILTGHHRTAAALIQGRPVKARRAAVGNKYFVTPNVFVDPDAESAAQQPIQDERTGTDRHTVPTLESASTLLERFGVPDDDIATVLRSAARRLAQERATRQ